VALPHMDHHRRARHAMTGWDLVHPDHGVAHVLPTSDLVTHDRHEDCVCGPTVEHVTGNHGPDGWVWTHHSLDNREVSE